VHTQYLNVRTNTRVQIIERGTANCSIATIGDDGLGRSRRVRAAAFHDSYLAHDGQPHTSGYVPVASLPAGHPHADRSATMDLHDIDLESLSDDELAAFILEQERIKKEAAEFADRAKAVAKYRRGGNTGLEIRGDIALVFSPNAKFDAPTARRNLSREDYQKILMPKPDATLARKMFENEPEKLEACLKDNGLTLTVRKATDEDREKFASAQPSNDEDFSFTA
jgi:hypothetical protein